jgi:hypothetical protein
MVSGCVLQRRLAEQRVEEAMRMFERKNREIGSEMEVDRRKRQSA